MQKTTLTITGKTDGFGAQYHAIMSGYAFCEYNSHKYEYIHTLITVIRDKHDDSGLNEFIGIPAGRATAIDITEPYIPLVSEASTPSKYYTDEVLKKIRAFYYSTDKPAECEYDIAIHIRRGDVGGG